VIFIAARGACSNAIHLEPYARTRETVIFLNSWLEILWVSDRPETS
jgi:hypothetical protein